MSSGSQVGPVSTPIGVPTPGYLSMTQWQYTPSFLDYAIPTKDGRKMLVFYKIIVLYVFGESFALLSPSCARA